MLHAKLGRARVTHHEFSERDCLPVSRIGRHRKTHIATRMPICECRRRGAFTMVSVSTVVFIVVVVNITLLDHQRRADEECQSAQESAGKRLRRR